MHITMQLLQDHAILPGHVWDKYITCHVHKNVYTDLGEVKIFFCSYMVKSECIGYTVHVSAKVNLKKFWDFLGMFG